ncbi:MAG: hypothetical protein AB8B87_21450 [Granulosicoccus sp.]
MYKNLVLVFCLVLPSISFPAEKADFLAFFEQYQRLSFEFDTSVVTMYADDAKIMGARKKADGTEEKMTIDGTRWKTIIAASMDQAKQVGDRSEYRDVDIELTEGRGKITATRYSTVDCFTDERFYMVVEDAGDNKLQIIEQFMETPVKSLCENSEPDLPEFLQSTVKMINEQLPAVIDAETHLVKTSAEGSQLTYHYVLVNYTSMTLSTDDAAAKLEPLVIHQSCNSPNMRPILDQDGLITYIYRGADSVQIVKFDIDKTVC